MNMYDHDSIIDSASQSSMTLVELADLNYYNDRQQIVRIRQVGSQRHFDFRLYPTFQQPNPGKHMGVLISNSDSLNNNGLSADRLNLLPGLSDENGNLADIPAGIVFLVSKTQEIKVADPQSGSAGFNISNINTFDEDKLRVSIAPPIDKSYTNNSQNDQDANKVGLFMNEKTAVLRSAGGSITLGDEGVHIGGKVFLQGGKQGKDVVADNPIHGLIPQTIPTAIISIPQIPNFGMILQIASTGLKVKSIVEKIAKVGKLL